MADVSTLLSLPPYGVGKEEKHALLTQALTELSLHHAQNCPEYAKLLSAFGTDLSAIDGYERLPALPVRLFKEFSLRSVPAQEVQKTMTSSGTTGQQVSRIYLDRETSLNQQKALSRIVSDFLGTSRAPMMILDTSAVVKNRAMFSARGAGILGFSMFGRDKIYALDEDMRLDVDGLKGFLDKHQGERIFLFGFTFMIWQHFYAELKRLGWKPDLSGGVLVHGGGWKKLSDQAVSPEAFKAALNDVCGITHVHNYYGMVEQTGSIYMECECGRLHAPTVSDVLIRRPMDFSLADRGERGLVEVVSALPGSYPGHVLLTEDEGALTGEDDCPCGRKGKTFQIFGRVKNAEVRGCSDTYEQRH